MLDSITIDGPEVWETTTITLPTGTTWEVGTLIEYATERGMLLRVDVNEADGLIVTAADAAEYNEDRAPGEPLIVTALLTPAERAAEEEAERKAEETRGRMREFKARRARQVEKYAAEARALMQGVELAEALAEFRLTFGTFGIGEAARSLSCAEADAAAGLLRVLGDEGGAADLLREHGRADDDPEDAHYQGPEADQG